MSLKLPSFLQFLQLANSSISSRRFVILATALCLTVLPQSLQAGANSESGESKTQNYVAGGVSMVVGGVLIGFGIPKAASKVPAVSQMGWMMIAMGSMSLTQGGTQIGTAIASGGSESDSAYTDQTIPEFDRSDFYIEEFGYPDLPNGDKPTPNNIKNEVGRLKREMARNGYDLENGILNGPNGESLDLSKLDGSMDPSALAASSGFDANAIGEVQKALAKANAKGMNKYKNKIAKLKMRTVTGGGGGRRPASAKGSGAPNFDLSGLLKKKKNKKKARIAGLQKKLGDTPIGVAADNIFDMIKRRYRAKHQRKEFLP